MLGIVKKTASAFAGLMLLSIPLLVSAQGPANYAYNGGHYISSSSLWGAKANITYNSKPAVYNDSMSSIWVMMDDKDSCALAQTGYAVDPPILSGQVYYFMGVINSACQYSEYTTGYGPAVGTNHEYKIYGMDNGATKTVYGAINGTNYWSDTITWTPDHVQYQEEIFNYDAQLMGTSSKHERFSNVRMLQSGTWVKPNITSWIGDGTNTGLDKSNYGTLGYFDVWDKRY